MANCKLVKRVKTTSVCVCVPGSWRELSGWSGPHVHQDGRHPQRSQSGHKTPEQNAEERLRRHLGEHEGDKIIFLKQTKACSFSLWSPSSFCWIFLVRFAAIFWGSAAVWERPVLRQGSFCLHSLQELVQTDKSSTQVYCKIDFRGHVYFLHFRAKVGELLPHVSSPKIHLQYAKAKEADGKYVCCTM